MSEQEAEALRELIDEVVIDSFGSTAAAQKCFFTLPVVFNL